MFSKSKPEPYSTITCHRYRLAAQLQYTEIQRQSFLNRIMGPGPVGRVTGVGYHGPPCNARNTYISTHLCDQPVTVIEAMHLKPVPTVAITGPYSGYHIAPVIFLRACNINYSLSLRA